MVQFALNKGMEHPGNICSVQRVARLTVWKRLKPIQSLLITILPMCCYVLAGAWIFASFGAPIELQRKRAAYDKVQSGLDIYATNILELLNQTASNYQNEQAYEVIRNELSQLSDIIFTYTDAVIIGNEWGMQEAAVHSLCLMTAIGSCVTTPPTTASRSIGILYGMLGLPLAVLTIGNVGKYLGKGAAHIVSFINRKIPKCHKANTQKEEVNLNDNKIPRVTFSQVLTMFLLYLMIGAALLPAFKDENFLSAMFLCFVNLTTVAVTHTHTYFTLIYLLFGLALTTVALEVASDYLRKVHFMGRKLCDACSVPIHFGGKDLSVAELLWAFGRKVGLAEDLMTKFLVGMDTFVSATIALKESGQLRKTEVLVKATIEAEDLGISEISFADDSDSH